MTVKILNNPNDTLVMPAGKSNGEMSTKAVNAKSLPTLQEIEERGEDAKRNMDQLEKLLETLKEKKSVSEDDMKEIHYLIKEINKNLHDKLPFEIEAMIPRCDTDEEPKPTPANISSEITNGDLGVALAILLKLQQQFQKLCNLMTEVAVTNLKATPAIVKSLANAGRDMLIADAQNQMFEAFKNLGTLATSAAAGGAMYFAQSKASEVSKIPEKTLANCNKLQNLHQSADVVAIRANTNPAQPAPAQLSNEVQTCLTKLQDPSSLPEIAENEESSMKDALKHFKAREPENYDRFVERVRTEKKGAADELNQHASNANSTSNKWTQFQQLGSSAIGAGIGYALEKPTTMGKAYNNSQSSTANAAEQQIQKTSDKAQQDQGDKKQSQEKLKDEYKGLVDSNTRTMR